MLLEEADILKYGKAGTNFTSFYIDKNFLMYISSENYTIDDIPFTLDYDIQIDAQKKQITGSEFEWNYSARYVIDSNNSISEVNDPYLKIRKTGNGGLLLKFVAHQVKRIESTDNITSNTKINFPVLEFTFDNALAGFDIFYKAPTEKDWIQLEKRIKYSVPIKSPFCYYKLKDEQTLEISFSSRDSYFQPVFNSDIKIIMYDTLGVDGNFDVYKGGSITLVPYTEKYQYNEVVTIAVKPVSASKGGSDRLTLEELRALTVESYSSAKEISNNHDIMKYFYDYKYRYNNEILVIKRRDDITERLFSAFLLMKNDTYIYPTNTLYLDIVQDQFDMNENNNRFVLKPGHCFVYKDDSRDTVRMIEGVMAYDVEALEELVSEYKFVYTNMFLISMTKKPNSIGLYKNIVSQNATLDYIYSSNESFVQFICSKLKVDRNADETGYKISVEIAPSTSIDKYIENLNTYKGNYVRVIAAFNSSANTEIAYMELYPVEINEQDTSAVTFSATVETNDYISSKLTFPLINVVKVRPVLDYIQIPIADNIVSIYILYDDGLTERNQFSDYFDDMIYFSVTNKYSTKSDKVTFIEPMNMMRSTVLFKNIGTEEEPIINANIALLPMIKADLINDEDNFNYFVDSFTGNYNWLEASLPLLRNNTHIDIKFYNTYGQSNNYYIGDELELIDRVNISVKFDVYLLDGTDEVELSEQIKVFIKEEIEQINSSGNNELFVSNLIRKIENKFPEVDHLKFNGFNEYTTDYQTISVLTTDLDSLSKEERRRYVPEMLVASKENILLNTYIVKNS